LRVDVDGVGIEFDVTGPDGGPPVLLLHGFPDSARVWRHQVPALADAGFRVIVPDLRGFGRSDKPSGVGAYNLLYLAGDALAVLDAVGVERAHVVGHDWGAGLAWGLAAFAGNRIDHLAALSVGHPASFRAAGIAQMERSWYMFFFRYPDIAERWLSDDGWAGLRAWGQHPDIEGVIADIERDGSLTPGLSWYRANLPPESRPPRWASGPPGTSPSRRCRCPARPPTAPTGSATSAWTTSATGCSSRPPTA
jgi:pimeloyl-ACP methyl ester carboxylesterase